MSCCGGGSYLPLSPLYGGPLTGYNACNGLYGGWNGGGYANWNLYGSPCLGFRGCQNYWVGLGGDGSGIGF
jgi:hypothetical protein